MINLVMKIIDWIQPNKQDLKQPSCNQIYVIKGMHILLLKELMPLQEQIIEIDKIRSEHSRTTLAYQKSIVY